MAKLRAEARAARLKADRKKQKCSHLQKELADTKKKLSDLQKGLAAAKIKWDEAEREASIAVAA